MYEVSMALDQAFTSVNATPKKPNESEAVIYDAAGATVCAVRYAYFPVDKQFRVVVEQA